MEDVSENSKGVGILTRITVENYKGEGILIGITCRWRGKAG